MTSMIRVTIASLALLALVPAPAAAQVEVLVGPFIGYGSSSISKESIDLPGAESRGGVALGVFAVYSLSQNVALEPQIYYNRKGARLPSDPGAFPPADAGELDIDYLTIPILLRGELRLGRRGRTRPHLFAGPVYNMSVRCTVSNGQECRNLFVKQNYFSLMAGLGVDWNGLRAQLRGDLGLSNTEFDARFSQVLFTLGYGFRIGGDPF